VAASGPQRMTHCGHSAAQGATERRMLCGLFQRFSFLVQTGSPLGMGWQSQSGPKPVG
jgi:hypothetical protein